MMSIFTLTAQPGNALGEGSLQNPNVRKTIALLGAFCMFLSTIEYMIPKPAPFLRLGIANLPLMLALDIFPFPAYMVLVGIKVTGQALVTGTLFSPIFPFSLAGTALAALSMYALRRLCKHRVSFIGISTLGAMMSSISQIAMARWWLMGIGVRYIAPPFLAAGLITGVALGIFCEVFVSRSRWHASLRVR